MNSLLTLAFFLLSTAFAINIDDDCMKAGKHSICFQFYPLQYKSCVDRIQPFYDHVSFFTQKHFKNFTKRVKL